MIQRYEVGDEGRDEVEDGEYVVYEDHLYEMNKLRKELEHLNSQLEIAKRVIKGDITELDKLEI